MSDNKLFKAFLFATCFTAGMSVIFAGSYGLSKLSIYSPALAIIVFGGFIWTMAATGFYFIHKRP